MQQTNDDLRKEIVTIFKSEGLEVAEKTAVNAIRAAFKILRYIVPKKSVGLGIIIDNVVDLVEPYVLSVIDKINGKDDPAY